MGPERALKWTLVASILAATPERVSEFKPYWKLKGRNSRTSARFWL